jgi:hypothetical protein
MDTVAVQTTPGVITKEQPSGLVEVVREDGSTVVDLRVGDGTAVATVYLDYQMVAALMVALGAGASEI